MRIDGIAVRGPWPAGARPVFERTLQLRENAQPSRRMVIEVEKVTLEKIGVSAFGLVPKDSFR